MKGAKYYFCFFIIINVTILNNCDASSLFMCKDRLKFNHCSMELFRVANVDRVEGFSNVAFSEKVSNVGGNECCRETCQITENVKLHSFILGIVAGVIICLTYKYSYKP